MAAEARVAVVTGVTGKAGRGIAQELARRGFRVVGTGRRADRGAEFEAEVRAEGRTAVYVTGDVSRVEDCERVVAAAVERWGRIDLLVNNAATVGEPPLVPSHELPEAAWDQVVDTNLKGAFYCSVAAVREMLRQGSGLVVNISSIMAVGMGPPQMAAYTASKAGMIALTKTMATEYADRGLRFNVIVLGGIEGDNADSVARSRSGSTSPEGSAAVRNRMTGVELAEVVFFLADDGARYINGAALTVDAGVSAGRLVARAMTTVSV
jgi:3-oxoacyl-[acyl-carrier protein] reductase